MNSHLAWLLALVVPVAGPAFAGPREGVGPRFVSLTFENDFFVGFDRHYTNGVQAAFLVDVNSVPAWMRDRAPFSSSTDPYFVLAAGQRIFTPADTDKVPPDRADRPYAGWLYVVGDWRVRADPGVIDHFTMTLGVVGPSARGRQTQNAVHDLLGQEPARGWDAQIGDRATIGVGYDRAWASWMQGRFGGRRYDLSPRIGVTVGNALTYANAGAVLRYGSELPSDLPTTAISLGPPRDGYRGTAAAGWYTWGGVDARVVGRNLFIDGGNSQVERKAYGYDLQAGAALVWPKARVSFAVVQRSREFKSQDKPDRFGQLSISFAY